MHTVTVSNVYHSSHAFLLWPQCSSFFHLMMLYSISERKETQKQVSLISLPSPSKRIYNSNVLLLASRTLLPPFTAMFNGFCWASLTTVLNDLSYPHVHIHTCFTHHHEYCPGSTSCHLVHTFSWGKCIHPNTSTTIFTPEHSKLCLRLQSFSKTTIHGANHILDMSS